VFSAANDMLVEHALLAAAVCALLALFLAGTQLSADTSEVVLGVERRAAQGGRAGAHCPAAERKLLLHGHPQAAGNANAHASSAEPLSHEAKRKSQTTAPMQQLLGKFRAGQNRWTVVNDDSSKPKEQIGMRNQVAAVECIKTNDFTIVADVGFAQVPTSRGSALHPSPSCVCQSSQYVLAVPFM
jgi:hypothetical protein